MEGYFKVFEDGFSLTIATFFNPETKEEFNRKVWDIDDDRLLYEDDIQELRHMPIDEKAKKVWEHFHGVISIGDMVEIVKGRKIPIGTKGTVVKDYWFKDRYGRNIAKYIVLDNGIKVNIDNCKLSEI